MPGGKSGTEDADGAMLAQQAAKKKQSTKHLLLQAVICVLCTLVGAFYPTLLDWSKTALQRTVFADHVVERRAYPFSSVSVVLINDALQLFLALCVIGKKQGIGGIASDRSLILKMMPLGAIYTLGELLTLRSVQKGSGPVYIVVANMKLVVAALMSRAVFGSERSLPWLHWFELVLISAAAGMYTVAEAGSLGSQWAWEGAWTALAKSSLVAFTSVFCEHVYKKYSFLAVVTIQAAWGLVTIVSVVAFSSAGLMGKSISHELMDDAGHFSLFAGGPHQPLCSSSAHLECLALLSQSASSASCTCITARGWNTYTLLAVVADLSNAISTALIFKRLSAVAKYICRAASAVPMYLFYCLLGRSQWDFRVFMIILYLCFQVSVYTLQRHRATAEQQRQDHGDFAKHYTGSSATGVTGKQSNGT